MEPPTTSQEAIGHDESPCTTGACHSSSAWVSSGRWPRSTPTASTGIRWPGWCDAAVPRDSPSASSADATGDEQLHDRARGLA